MIILKAALILFVAAMVAFVVAGIVLTHARFFIFIGIVGLIVYMIYSFVKARGTT
jgi:hypothetical protein